MELFCAIKGVPALEVATEVEARLAEIGLADKASNLVKQLSGGMQRKLSVAISLTAGSRFVILDEPTAVSAPPRLLPRYLSLDQDFSCSFSESLYLRLCRCGFLHVSSAYASSYLPPSPLLPVPLCLCLPLRL